MRLLTFIISLILISGSAFAFGEGKLLKKGMKALEAGELQTAKVYFNESINKNPKFSRGYSFLAYVQSQLGETDDAIMNYRMAAKFDKKDFSSRTNLCDLLIDKGDLVGAHNACTEAISINPESHKAHNNRCIIFLEQKRYASAIADCSQAILLKRDYVSPYNNRGMAYIEINELLNAHRDFSMAIKINPDNALAYNNRCAVNKELRKYDDAIADCTESIKLDDSLIEAYSNRGAVYEMKGNKMDAILDYRKYLQHNPEAEVVRQKMKRLLKGE